MPRRPRVLKPDEPNPDPASYAPVLRNDPIPDAALGLEAEDWTRRLDHIYGGVNEDLKLLLERFARFEKGWPLKPATRDDGEPEGFAKWNDDVAGRVADLRRDFQDALKKSENLHDIEKAPILRAQRSVDGYQNKFAERIGFFSKGKLLFGADKPLNVLTDRLNVYLLHQERVRRRKAEQEAIEARRIADAAIQRASTTMSSASLDHAADAAGRAAEAESTATAPAAELSRVRGEGGSVASLRSRYTFDPDGSDLMVLVKAIAEGRAPLHFVTFAETRIGYEIRSGTPPLRECPGLVIKQDLKA